MIYTLDLSELGKRLKKIREKKDLSVTALVELSDVDRNTINKIEAGNFKKGVTIQNFFKLLNALNVLVEDVVTVENKQDSAPERRDFENRSMKYFSQLKDSTQETIFNMMRDFSKDETQLR